MSFRNILEVRNVSANIWMVLFGKIAKGRIDLIFTRRPRQTKALVVILTSKFVFLFVMEMRSFVRHYYVTWLIRGEKRKRRAGQNYCFYDYKRVVHDCKSLDCRKGS